MTATADEIPSIESLERVFRAAEYLSINILARNTTNPYAPKLFWNILRHELKRHRDNFPVGPLPSFEELDGALKLHEKKVRA